MKKLTASIIFLIAMSVVYTQFNPKNKDQFDPILTIKFQDALDEIVETYGCIGASVAIDMPGKGTWQGVYGMSDPVTNDSIRTDMLFGIGSNTKTFVSTLILLLAEDGLLTLDDSLHAWLPDFTYIDTTATIRQLLNHTSGIYNFTDNSSWEDSLNSDFDKYWTPEDCLGFVLSPNFSPGESWSYSNTNYILAGMIIKEVTGSSVSTMFHERILDPLNLNNTFLDIEEPLIGDLAHGWENGGDVFYTPRTSYYSFAWTAGAIVSNSSDMVKWSKALYSGQVLQQSSLDEMFTLIDIASPDYGLGTMNVDWVGENIWLHGGAAYGYRSQVIYCPRLDVSISVLLNERPSDPDIITKKLLLEVLAYYDHPHDKVYPLDISLSQTYIRPNTDNLVLTSKINNPKNHNVVAYSYIISVDSTYIDSIILYDDGFHNDSLAGDCLFGNTFNTIPVENEFNISVHTTDTDSVYEHTINQINQFTTIGPLILEDYKTTIFPVSNTYAMYLDITVKNVSSNKVITQPKLIFCSPDSIFRSNNYSAFLSDIPAGESLTKRITCIFVDGYFPTDVTEIISSLNISSKNYFYSENNITISLESGIINNVNLVKYFRLEQNYPNPFNPTTVINFSVPQNNSEIKLLVYNVNGQIVSTLFDGVKNIGRYSANFDATNLNSGVYYYSLSVNGVKQATKKMVLVK